MPSDVMDGDIRVEMASRKAGPHLGFGWSIREREGKRGFRWVSHLEADILFDLKTAADLDLWVTAAPLYLAHRRQNIGVYINDRFVTEWLCPDSPAYSDYHAVIPAKRLKVGPNRLTFRMGYRRRMGSDRRELSLAVERILLRKRGP
jgi:hypothetical protein